MGIELGELNRSVRAVSILIIKQSTGPRIVNHVIASIHCPARCIALEHSRRLVGAFVAWALTDNENARRWLVGDLTPTFEETLEGDTVVLMIGGGTSAKTVMLGIRYVGSLYPGRSYMIKRLVAIKSILAVFRRFKLRQSKCHMDDLPHERLLVSRRVEHPEPCARLSNRCHGEKTRARLYSETDRAIATNTVAEALDASRVPGDMHAQPNGSVAVPHLKSPPKDGRVCSPSAL